MDKQLILPVLLGGLMAISSSAPAETWQPAAPKLMTEWGANVTPETAWPEYPRPQLARERWLNLNGLWDYALAPTTAPQPAQFDGRILVPYAVESALSGVGKPVTPNDRIWYRRTFTVPADWVGNRVLLHFGAVDYECSLWINGGLAGSHVGGSDAFTFDITPFLRPAGENELVLGVTDPTDTGEQPRGKQQLEPRGIWYTPVSGIWQTVWLEPVPKELFLAEVRLTPDVAGKRVSVVPLLNVAADQEDLAVRITATMDGKTSVGSTVIRANREGWLSLSELKLWSPDSPFLYDLKAELVRVKPPAPNQSKPQARSTLPSFGEKERAVYAQAEVVGEPLDVVTSYFGMRDLTMRVGRIKQQPQLLFNNEALFQHGPLDQGWWPDGLLTPPSDAAMVWELQWLKSAGFNMLRKHIKIEPARYYYHCDRLGIMVWQDMPSGFNRGLRNHREDEGEPFRLSASREQHELELRRMINRLAHHPSIVMWVIHNEGWGQYESVALTRWVKAIDPTRWVNGISGWLDQNISDIYDIHTYQETPHAPANQADRAIVIGEYGGVGWPVAGHLWDANKRNWGYQTYQTEAEYQAALLKKIEALIPMHRDLALSAAVYTQTTDVEGEINGFMTYDRKKIKIAPEILKEINGRLIERPAAPAAP